MVAAIETGGSKLRLHLRLELKLSIRWTG